MTENVDTTGESQVKETQEETQETVPAEPTVADLHESKPEKAEKPKLVPISRLDKEIARRKELEEKLAQYETTSEDVDEDKVERLAKEIDSIKEKERRAHLDAVFSQNLAKALENAPEYKDIVNPEVIKRMAFDPANANKTYRQLLDEAYGNALTGRRTIENTVARGGAKDTKLDMERAKTDTAYRHEVLADPELRKQYNATLTDRIFR